MNNKGYTVRELLIVLGIVTLIAIVSITRISFAFSNIDNSEEIKKDENLLIKKAAEVYAAQVKDEVKEKKELYVTGKELIEKNILMDDKEYNNLKIKLEYNEENDEVITSIVTN